MTERLRVLILLANLAGGGAERTVVRLLQNIDRDRFEPKLGVLWAKGPFVTEVPEGDLLLPNWIPPQEGTPLPILALAAPLAHMSFLRRFDPHVVMSLTASMNLAAGLAVRLRRKPCGWVLREGNNTWRMIRDDLPNSFLAWGRKSLTGLLYRRADRVLAISQGLGDGLVENFGVSDSRVEVIHNPVEFEQTAPWTPPPVEAPHILAIGRLEYQKGFDVLLKALALMRNSQTRLTILGEGSRREELQSLAAGLGLATRVEFPGFVSDIGRYLESSSVFCLSSRWEGFGCVVIEAMAAGVPVVVTECDYGPPEIVTDRKNGLLVPPEDPQRLAQALDEVVDSQELSQAFSVAGLERAEDFRVEAVTRRYEALWESMKVSPTSHKTKPRD